MWGMLTVETRSFYVMVESIPRTISFRGHFMTWCGPNPERGYVSVFSLNSMGKARTRVAAPDSIFQRRNRRGNGLVEDLFTSCDQVLTQQV